MLATLPPLVSGLMRCSHSPQRPVQSLAGVRAKRMMPLMARRTGRRRVGEFTSQRGGALALRGFGAARSRRWTRVRGGHQGARRRPHDLRRCPLPSLRSWRGDRFRSRVAGPRAGGERRVARALRPLERRGWQIDHDVAKPRGGNVDHIALGPNGLFTIETKLNRFGKRELTQARGHAFATMRLGGRYPAAGAGLCACASS